MTETIRIWMQGAIAMAYLVVMFHFIRFRRQTGQPIFTFFSVGFGVLALHRTLFGLWGDEPSTFVVRLAGYLLILAGILAQARRRSAATTPPSS